HARAKHAGDTRWARIAELYSMLFAQGPSPIIALNHAVAIAMAYGPEEGLKLIEDIEASGELDDYYLMWSAKAELLRRAQRKDDAASAYRRALNAAKSGPERRFLKRRLAECDA